MKLISVNKVVTCPVIMKATSLRDCMKCKDHLNLLFGEHVQCNYQSSTGKAN